MKMPLAISAAIIASAALLGFHLDGRLGAARRDAGKLAEEATLLGISVRDGNLTRGTKSVRVDREAEAKQLAVEYGRWVKMTEKEDKLDEESREAYRKHYIQISSLDAPALTILIGELLANQELEEKNRKKKVVNLLWPLLSQKDGRAALEFTLENRASLKDTKNFEDVISDSLGSWAKDDPLAAVEWMRRHSAEIPDAMSIQSQANVFYATAPQDPRLACSIIKLLELDFSHAHSALNDIVSSAKTDDERTSTLAALREFREANRSDKDLGRAVDDNVAYFADSLRKTSFESGHRWIEDAKLGPKELDRICGKLSNGIVEEPEKWIEWMGNAFPPGNGDSPIMEMIGSWTSRDYEAAGMWLASAPDGPAKNAAIRGYAQTIFKHDPETAMQWIMTLPPSLERDSTLQNIHLNWPKDDPEGAAAFAKEHGIK